MLSRKFINILSVAVLLNNVACEKKPCFKATSDCRLTLECKERQCCNRAYGDNPLDIALYGLHQPCKDYGKVRCLDQIKESSVEEANSVNSDKWNPSGIASASTPNPSATPSTESTQQQSMTTNRHLDVLSANPVTEPNTGKENLPQLSTGQHHVLTDKQTQSLETISTTTQKEILNSTLLNIIYSNDKLTTMIYDETSTSSPFTTMDNATVASDNGVWSTVSYQDLNSSYTNDYKETTHKEPPAYIPPFTMPSNGFGQQQTNSDHENGDKETTELSADIIHFPMPSTGLQQQQTNSDHENDEKQTVEPSADIIHFPMPSTGLQQQQTNSDQKNGEKQTVEPSADIIPFTVPGTGFQQQQTNSDHENGDKQTIEPSAVIIPFTMPSNGFQQQQANPDHENDDKQTIQPSADIIPFTMPSTVFQQQQTNSDHEQDDLNDFQGAANSDDVHELQAEKPNTGAQIQPTKAPNINSASLQVPTLAFVPVIINGVEVFILASVVNNSPFNQPPFPSTFPHINFPEAPSFPQSANSSKDVSTEAHSSPLFIPHHPSEAYSVLGYPFSRFSEKLAFLKTKFGRLIKGKRNYLSALVKEKLNEIDGKTY